VSKEKNLDSFVEGPNIKKWVFNNSATCVTADMPDSDLTCLDFWCKAGSSFEEKGEEGLAHFLEHMVFKGSEGLDAGEFDFQIEAIGGSSNAATGFDDVHYHVLVPSNSIETALELLTNLVLKPSLCPDAYATELEVVLEEIAQYQDQPDDQVFQKLLGTCWGDHPYGRSILGFEESLRKSNPDLMRSFHDRLYKAENSCLAIAGAIPENIEDLLKRSYIPKFKSENENISIKNIDKLNFNHKRIDIKIPRLESARILISWPIPPASEQLIIMGIEIAISILSEGRRSRLVDHLREKLQIVESIDMDITSLEEGGLVLLEAICKEEDLEEVEKEIKIILKKTLNELPGYEELERAKNIVRNGFCFGLEASYQVASFAGSCSLWGRNKEVMAPLKHIEYWTINTIKEVIFPLLQNRFSSTLIIKPEKE